MSDVNLDLGSLFEKAWGRPSEAFDPQLPAVQGDVPGKRVEAGAVANSPYWVTDPKLGVEYFMPVKVIFPTTVYMNGLITNAVGGSPTGAAPAGQLKEWWLPFPVISVKMRKNIVATGLTERRGTVKELINIEDCEITIKGFIISPTDDWPEAEVTTMRDLFEVNEAITIKNPMTDIWLLRAGKSDTVVVKELSFPGLKGVPNVEPYELVLVSDEVFSLVDIS